MKLQAKVESGYETKNGKASLFTGFSISIIIFIFFYYIMHT